MQRRLSDSGLLDKSVLSLVIYPRITRTWTNITHPLKLPIQNNLMPNSRNHAIPRKHTNRIAQSAIRLWREDLGRRWTPAEQVAHLAGVDLEGGEALRERVGRDGGRGMVTLAQRPPASESVQRRMRPVTLREVRCGAAGGRKS
jgi:hypothetical protein